MSEPDDHKQRAQKHLLLLYTLMGIMILLPFIALWLFSQSKH
jgi:hypothetical protein